MLWWSFILHIFNWCQLHYENNILERASYIQGNRVPTTNVTTRCAADTCEMQQFHDISLWCSCCCFRYSQILYIFLKLSLGGIWLIRFVLLMNDIFHIGQCRYFPYWGSNQGPFSQITDALTYWVKMRLHNGLQVRATVLAVLVMIGITSPLHQWIL